MMHINGIRRVKDNFKLQLFSVKGNEYEFIYIYNIDYFCFGRCHCEL